MLVEDNPGDVRLIQEMFAEIDADGMEQINNTYGHPTGDTAFYPLTTSPRQLKVENLPWHEE